MAGHANILPHVLKHKPLQDSRLHCGQSRIHIPDLGKMGPLILANQEDPGFYFLQRASNAPPTDESTLFDIELKILSCRRKPDDLVPMMCFSVSLPTQKRPQASPRHSHPQRAATSLYLQKCRAYQCARPPASVISAHLCGCKCQNPALVPRKVLSAFPPAQNPLLEKMSLKFFFQTSEGKK